MTTKTMVIRLARSTDAPGISLVHDEAWRESYRGVISGVALEKAILARGPLWWDRYLRHNSGIQVIDFAGKIGGYVTYGRSRRRSERFASQIYELYLKPEFQGIGFGRKLFEAARTDLSHGVRPFVPLVVWALSENDRADGFYRHLGGHEVGRRSDLLGAEAYETVGFGFS